MNSVFSDQQPLRIGVLISGGGSTLANLIEHTRDQRLRFTQIAVVISSRQQVRGVKIARAAGLPLHVIRPRDYASAEAFSAAITQALDQANVDLVVMAGFLCLWMFPPEYAGRVLNIHPALLPDFGGPGMYGHHVHEAVLQAGQRESGCTVHLADHQYDQGSIVAQARVPVVETDTPDALAARVQEAERALYPQVIQAVATHGIAWLTEECDRFRQQPSPGC